MPLLSWLESLQKHRQRAQELGAGNGAGQPDLGAVKIIEVQFGSYLGENSIVRPHDDYGGT